MCIRDSPIRAPAVPPAGTAQNLSFPLDEESAIPAPRIPPINEPSLQSLSSIFLAWLWPAQGITTSTS